VLMQGVKQGVLPDHYRIKCGLQACCHPGKGLMHGWCKGLKLSSRCWQPIN